MRASVDTQRWRRNPPPWVWVSGIVCVLVAIFGVVARLTWDKPVHHPGGDPGGRLMAEMVPVVRVVPGFENGNIPWLADCPASGCNFPPKYAMKIEPFWDSCDGVARTGGWAPAIIQMGLPWKGTAQDLVATLDRRLASRGWVEVQDPPLWAEDHGSYRTWDYPPGQPTSETLALNSPMDGLGWMVVIEAKPVGRLVDCSR